MKNFTILSFETDKLSREETRDNEIIFKRHLNQHGTKWKNCIGQSVQWGRERSIIMYRHLTDIEKQFVFDIGKQEAIITDQELLFANGDSVEVEKVYNTLDYGSFYDIVRKNRKRDCTIVPFNGSYTEIIEIELENK